MTRRLSLAVLALAIASRVFVPAAAQSGKSAVAREWMGRVPSAKADEYFGYLVELPTRVIHYDVALADLAGVR